MRLLNKIFSSDNTSSNLEKKKTKQKKKKKAKYSAPRATKGIEIKSPKEIEIMRISSKIVATVLKEISEIIEPGMTTKDVDAYA